MKTIISKTFDLPTTKKGLPNYTTGEVDSIHKSTRLIKHNSTNWNSLMRSLFFIAILFVPTSLFGQESVNSITVKHITEDIKLDGVLDEAVWETAETIGDFWQFFPSDSVMAQNQTVTRILYDDHTLYVGIRATVPSDNYTVSSLRRDFSGRGNDNVTLMFDTFSDGSNAYLFGTTPYGVQRESLISNGGSGFNASWDNKWQVESTMFDDHYVLEFAIPFSSMKFPEGETKWRMQCYRWDLQSNEQSAWAQVPQNQQLSTLAFMGEMEFEKPLGKSSTPIAIIPYINAISQKEFSTGLSNNDFKVGGDAKVSIGNSMNLDITVNPDFSNVEVDNIVTNLTRFEVFLPEKRQFFMDNSDLFSNFGSIYSDARPFFSRRIGIARNNEGNTIENPILGGVRLSGKIGQDWRLGFLNMQTDEDINNGIASNNNMMLAVQKRVFSRSNIGFFVVNRETFKDYDFQNDNDKYNRVIGVDYNLASSDNTWRGKFYLHKSLNPEDKKGNLSTQATTTYNTRKFSFTTDWVYVNKDFKADLGFVPRRGYLKAGNGVIFKFYPKSGIINTHSINPLSLFYWNPYNDLQRTDHRLQLSWRAEFKDQSTLSLRLQNQYVYLSYDFDPTRTVGGTPLPGNMGYDFNQLTASYQSNYAKRLTFNASSTVGEFYNGNIFSLDGELSLKMQPWVLFTLNMNYDGIRLPEPYSKADIWLVSPKVDVTFSKSLFWSTLVQYSNQRDNLGINSRLQWRYAPLSDLYLVYNDNYSTDNFSPKFRSINLKLTYWLNL